MFQFYLKINPAGVTFLDHMRSAVNSSPLQIEDLRYTRTQMSPLVCC